VGKKDNPFLQSKPVGRVRVNLLMERGTKSSTNRELNMGHPTEGLHLDLGQPESANPAVDGLYRKPENCFGMFRKSLKCPPWMLKSSHPWYKSGRSPGEHRGIVDMTSL
jgi:uncharacterized protein involved in tellurium resistance